MGMQTGQISQATNQMQQSTPSGKGGAGGASYVPSTIPSGNQEIIIEMNVSYRLN